MPKQKPEKPYEDYPFYAHRNGQWAKRIRGKIHYFGKWESLDEALELFLKERDHLQAGITPPNRSGHTILDVCDRFLVKRLHDVRVSELSQATYDDYKTNCDLLPRLAGDWCIEEMQPEHWAKLRADLC